MLNICLKLAEGDNLRNRANNGKAFAFQIRING